MRWREVNKLLVPFFITGNITISCNDNSKVEDEEESRVISSHEQTNQFGRTKINNLEIRVLNENNQPLENITVHYLEDEHSFFSFVTDKQGRYIPSLPQRSSSQYALTEKIIEKETIEQPLVRELLFVLNAISAGVTLYKSSRKSKRTLLDNERNVNRYCMTLEQMTNEYIDVPTGILFISANALEYDEEMIKIAATLPLNELFEDHIKKKYGEHAGYEVWVPKTVMSICGEEYRDIICPITTESLSKRIWEHADVPIWEIKGPCKLEKEIQTANDEQIYGMYDCEEFCMKINYNNYNNDCLNPCLTDYDCSSDTDCYSLIDYQRNGCFFISCDDNCPPSSVCSSLDEDGHLTNSAAEVLTSSFSLNYCVPNICK